jgi:hypothetical protein
MAPCRLAITVSFTRFTASSKPGTRVVTHSRVSHDWLHGTIPGCHQLNRVFFVTPGGCQIGYMDHTVIHWPFDWQNDVSEKWYSTLPGTMATMSLTSAERFTVSLPSTLRPAAA